MENFPHYLSEENQSLNKTDLPNMELNQLLQKCAKLNLQSTVTWKFYFFPSIQQLLEVEKKTQFFGLDLVDEMTERTIWTHKASVWKDVFELVPKHSETCQVQTIDKMFDGIFAYAVRGVPNGPSEAEFFHSGKGQRIQHWILLVPMPVNADPSQYIQEFISKFVEECKRKFIRSAYHAGVKAITTHEGLIQQVDEDGNYWYGMENAVQKDFILKTNNCLSEILLDKNIPAVVNMMFGEAGHPNTWSDTIKNYAFGK